MEQLGRRLPRDLIFLAHAAAAIEDQADTYRRVGLTESDDGTLFRAIEHAKIFLVETENIMPQAVENRHWHESHVHVDAD